MIDYCNNGKVIYISKDEANKSAKNTRSTNRSLRVYNCDECSGFHLATRSKNKKMKNLIR